MRGTEKNLLSDNNQKSLLKFIEKNPFSQSFFIYNRQQLENQVSDWNQKLGWISPHYAIKSNPIRPLIKDILKNQVNFDCASKSEIQKVLSLGARPDQIILSNTIKDDRDILYSKQVGVQLTTADTLEELVKIKQIAPDMKILWRISIEENESKNLATIFSKKFGDDFECKEKLRKKFIFIRDMGIQLSGIHFHCGSGYEGSENFKQALDIARRCLIIGRELGHSMEILDIGGGFPADRLTPQIVDVLKTTRNDPLNYRIMAEPGRYFSSKSCLLATRVIGKRKKNEKLCYHINDSLYHSFNCNIMDGVSFEFQNDQFYSQWDNYQDNVQSLSVFNQFSSKADGFIKKKLMDQNLFQEGSLFGMTCDGYDIITKSIKVPEMNVGDWIIIQGMGAYTFGPKSSFNGMETTNKVFAWREEKESQQKVLRFEKVLKRKSDDMQIIHKNTIDGYS